MSSHHRLAIQQAKVELALKPVYLDTETTGLDACSEIIDICILDYDGTVLLDTLVKPTRAIPRDVTQIHHITNAMVKDAPTWAEVWGEARPILLRRRVAIYNSDFDVRMMQQSHVLNQLRWTIADSNFWCVMKMYAQFRGEWNSRYGNYKWCSLEVAAHHCGIQVAEAHRAFADAETARRVHHYLAQLNEKKY